VCVAVVVVDIQQQCKTKPHTSTHELNRLALYLYKDNVITTTDMNNNHISVTACRLNKLTKSTTILHRNKLTQRLSHSCHENMPNNPATLKREVKKHQVVSDTI